MLTRRRVLVLLAVVAAVAVGYTAWLAFQVRTDLADAQMAAERLQSAFEGDDKVERDLALEDFRSAAARAEDRTQGAGWSVLVHLPLVGDDATGVRALSSSLDVVASDGAAPLIEVVDLLDRLSVDGRVDVKVLGRLEAPVAEAQAAFSDAAAELRDLDSSGYAGSVKRRFDGYVDTVTKADRVLTSAKTATGVLPGMVGANGPRDYLLVFQNNAEIRATGGMPGSWALVHADGGELEIKLQGTAFTASDEPILPLSAEELDVYDRQLGTYWQDAGFTPDFPRAADLMAAHFEANVPAVDLDGVIALDPVAMSYLLVGTGPIDVGSRTLTADNVVDELLSRPYRELGPAAQDGLFRDAARKIFDAATGELADPVEFVKGLGRAADEGRLLVASFVDSERKALAASRVRGALAADDGRTPHVDIGLNDATGSKMSYYLRYSAEVDAQSCADGRQSLRGTMSLSQSISARDASELPEYVTGDGQFGTDPGSQLVLVRIYAPWGGAIDDIRMDGKAVTAERVELDGRPVVTLVVLLSSVDDVMVTWSMETGVGQSGDVELDMTPSIVPGDNRARTPSAC